MEKHNTMRDKLKVMYLTVHIRTYIRYIYIYIYILGHAIHNRLLPSIAARVHTARMCIGATGWHPAGARGWGSKIYGQSAKRQISLKDVRLHVMQEQECDIFEMLQTCYDNKVP